MITATMIIITISTTAKTSRNNKDMKKKGAVLRMLSKYKGDEQ